MWSPVTHGMWGHKAGFVILLGEATGSRGAWAEIIAGKHVHLAQPVGSWGAGFPFVLRTQLGGHIQGEQRS